MLRPQISAARLAAAAAGRGAGCRRSCPLRHGADIDLRWPNDLLIGPRKVGGILVESSTNSKSLPYAVVGIGINVHQHKLRP